MLRSLKAIRLWEPINGRLPTAPAMRFELHGKSRRWTSATDLAPGDHEFVGEVEVTTSRRGLSQRTLFAGIERLYNSPVLKELQRSNVWPSWSTVNSATGATEAASDKAAPHCAAYFTRSRADRPELSIGRAVFLPVGESFERRPIAEKDAGRWAYHLVLHGYFFVDSGRSRIDLTPIGGPGGPDEERALQRVWNGELYRNGVLPLVLPALERFVTSAGLERRDTERLTGALQDSTLFGEDRRLICAQHQWAARFPARLWQRHEASKPLYQLPAPPDGAPDRPLEVFPSLEDIGRDHLVTVAGWPRLRADDAPDNWPVGLLVQLLDLPVADVFGDEGRLSYLTAFLNSLPDSIVSSSPITLKLARLARQAFRDVPLRRLRSHRATMQRFLSLVPPRDRLAMIAEPSAGAVDLQESLLRLRLGVLLLPRDFDPEQQSAASVSTDDAASVLETLAGLDRSWATRETRAFRTAIALQVVASTGERKIDLLKRCGDLKLFSGFDQASGAEADLSCNELATCLSSGMLFVEAPPSTARELAGDLQLALHGIRVLVVSSRVSEKLFDEPVTSCSVRACVSTLLCGARVGPAQSRMPLLRKLIAEGSNTDRDALRKAVRYLLHGQRDHINDIGPLLIEEGAGGRGAWSKLARVIRRMGHGEWRLVPRSLGDAVAREQWTEYRLDEVGHDSVVELLQHVNVDALDCSGFSADDRAVILRHVDDTSVLRGMRIHESLDGLLVRINAGTYLDGGFHLDRASFAAITVVAKLGDADLVEKQRRLMPVLDAQVVLKTVLSHKQPSLHWQLLLQALGALNRGGGPIDPSLEQNLRSTNWLPHNTGEAIAPRDVIYLPGLEDETARVVARSGVAFRDVLCLAAAVRTHEQFDLLAKLLFPDRADALAMLGEIMGQTEEYRVGPLPNDTFELDAFLEAFHDAPRHLMPCVPLLDGVVQKLSAAECEQNLLPELLLPIPAQRVDRILRHLSDGHARAGKRAEKLLIVHNWYLEVAAGMDEADFRLILSEARLLSRAGRWKPASQLCLDCEGIADDDVLDLAQGKIVSGRVHAATNELSITWSGVIEAFPSRTQPDWEHEFDRSARLLREYFQVWRGAVAPELIGGFLSMLGDYPAILELSTSYLGNRTIEATRDLIEWERLEGHLGSAGESVHEMMRKQRFVIQVSTSEDITVSNLLGSTFRARTNSNVTHLLLGKLFGGDMLTPEKLRVKRIILRRIDPTSFSEVRLAEILRESAARLLRYVYVQRVPNLDAVWEQLGQSEQLDIQVARKLLINDLFFYLRQLGVRSHHEMNQILRHWDQVRRLEAEEEETSHLRRNLPERRAAQALANVRAELERLLIEDPTAQQVVLEAVRCLMLDRYQYTPQSVPFELFQNADDAVVELAEMLGADDQPDPITWTFVVVEDAGVLTFMHWGRRINQYTLQGFDGRERGFDRDLEKMLVLSASDKQPTNDVVATVTGRFGLGFKSVFILTDVPRLMSGHLCFKVVGGFLPQRLLGNEASHLKRGFTSHWILRAVSTVAARNSRGYGDRAPAPRSNTSNRRPSPPRLQAVGANPCRLCTTDPAHRILSRWPGSGTHFLGGRAGTWGARRFYRQSPGNQ